MPARTLVPFRGTSTHGAWKSLHSEPNEQLGDGDPLASENRTDKIDINGFIFIHGHNVRCWKRPWHSHEAPSIEQQFLLQYSIPSERHRRLVPAPNHPTPVPVAPFSATGGADWPTLPRSQREKAQPTTSLQHRRLVPPTIPKSMARLSHKPRLLTVKRRCVAERPWLTAVRVVIEA
jgi:hypothetical protein